MKYYIGLLTTAVCLLVLPGTVLAEKDGGIPPMLETQRPLSMPTTQPEPRAPKVDSIKPVAHASKGTKTQKAQRKTGKHKTTVASHKKTTKTAKKKGGTVKHRSKVAANH